MHICNSTIFSFNFVVNFLVALIALTVAYYSYRAHKVTKTNEFGYFSLGFLSLSAAFTVYTFSMIVWAINASHIIGTLTAYSHSACLLLFKFFVLLGIVLILFATTKFRNFKYPTYIFMFVIVLSLFHSSLFYVAATFLLLIICFNYYIKFIQKNNHNSLLILISMLLFLLGIIRFIFIQRYFCPIQPFLFLISFAIMYWVVIKAYKN